MSVEIQLQIIRIVAINNTHIIQTNAKSVLDLTFERPREPRPRYYISTHLFKARTVCRSLAKLGTEVFKHLVQEERYEHYRRVVFPGRTPPVSILSLLESPQSYLKDLPIDGVEFHLHPDAIPADASKASDQGAMDTPRMNEADTELLRMQWGTLDAMTAKHAAYTEWLDSPVAVTFLQRLFRLSSKPPTLYLVEPCVSAQYFWFPLEFNTHDESAQKECKAALKILEMIAKAKLNIRHLVWMTRTGMLPCDALEESFLAQEALLNLRSAHINIEECIQYSDSPDIGRLLMEFCKNLQHLSIELGRGEEPDILRSWIVGALLAALPRVRSLTFINTRCSNTDLREYLEYASDTIEEVNFRDMEDFVGEANHSLIFTELLPPAERRLREPSDCHKNLGFWLNIIETMPDLHLKTITAVLDPETTERGARRFWEDVSDYCEPPPPEEAGLPRNIVPYLHAKLWTEGQRLSNVPPLVRLDGKAEHHDAA